jgi:hypothetical protein
MIVEGDKFFAAVTLQNADDGGVSSDIFPQESACRRI